MVCCSAETAIAALPVPRAALARNWNLPSCSGADGETTALYFEGMDPIIVDWELKRNEKDVLAVRTGKGPMVATFEENGALAKLVRSQGKATVRYESARETSFGGPGMPPMNTRPGRAETARESEQPAPEDGQ